MLDQFLFPAPASSYDEQSYPRELLLLPAGRDGAAQLPALYFTPRDPHSGSELEPLFLLLVLHGNAMDVGHVAIECQLMADALRCAVMAPEYPGYGLYRSRASSKEGFDETAFQAFHFARATMKWPPQRILLLGRSIGTGVAAHLARRVTRELRSEIGGLILISPYTSILGIVEDQAGCMARLFQHRWRPELDVAKCGCPLLLLHGAQDTLIPPHHAAKLYDIASGGTPGPPQGTELPQPDRIHIRSHPRSPESELWLRLSSRADHNQWEYDLDILEPVKDFCGQVVAQRTAFASAAPPADGAFRPDKHLFLRAQGRRMSGNAVSCLSR
eukprot:TRINITY_DN50661_c0_g1_i1.p1 TRINITY_DN50661_c0_g1~~TRINITY_DN50661_c0_g1_i1.p1  ORF type:complete len:360 (+),score=106.60 TRINITY_DN50661_c0_g1_i1:96-1082(+)